jgi:hypothetical protein
VCHLPCTTLAQHTYHLLQAVRRSTLDTRGALNEQVQILIGLHKASINVERQPERETAAVAEPDGAGQTGAAAAQ